MKSSRLKFKIAVTALVAGCALLAVVPGLAQSDAASSGAPQNEPRTGYSRPAPVIITSSPDDDTDQQSPEAVAPPRASAAPTQSSLQPTAPTSWTTAPAKPSAAIPMHANPDAAIVGDRVAGQPADAAADPDAGIVTHVFARPYEVADGTVLKVKLLQEISTFTTKPGTGFSAEVTEPVMKDGKIVIPSGSVMHGRVTMLRSGRRIGGPAAIHLEPRTVTLPDGSHFIIHARVIDTEGWKDVKVDDEGTILKRDHAKETAAVIGGTTGGGALVGGALAGPPGALVGAGVGAGVGTTLWLKENLQEELPKNAGLVFCLTEPMGTIPLRDSATNSGAETRGAN